MILPKGFPVKTSWTRKENNNRVIQSRSYWRSESPASILLRYKINNFPRVTFCLLRLLRIKLWHSRSSNFLNLSSNSLRSAVRNKFQRDNNLFREVIRSKPHTDCHNKTSKPACNVIRRCCWVLACCTFIFSEINNHRILLTRSWEINININILINPLGFPSPQNENEDCLSVYISSRRCQEWVVWGGGEDPLCVLPISDKARMVTLNSVQPGLSPGKYSDTLLCSEAAKLNLGKSPVSVGRKSLSVPRPKYFHWNRSGQCQDIAGK